MDVICPQSFFIREKCNNAATQSGYRLRKCEQNGWSSFESTTADGTIWLAAGGAHGPWLLAIDHPGIIQEWKIPSADIPGPGLARYAFPTLTELHTMLQRLYHLAARSSDTPLQNL